MVMPEQGPKAVATGQRAMVSTSHPAVTDAALAVLRDGGNAADAMLTAMPLQMVLEPQMSTLAGGFAMLYWDAETRTAQYLNANLDHPTGSAIPDRGVKEADGSRIGVPGTVAGMAAAHARYGSRPWASYFAPAIAAATDGFPMYSFLYGEMASAYNRLVYYPSGRERYTPGGYLPRVGEIYRQPQLAQTLRRVAQDDGADWFQRGAFAETFAAAVRDTDGAMTEDDLAAYAPRWDAPLAFTANGVPMLGAPPPETGGLFVAYALGLLERAGLDPGTRWTDDPRAFALIARALAEAEAMIARYCADPVSTGVPTDLLLSPAHLDLQARLLLGGMPKGDLAAPKQAGDAPPPAAPDATDPAKTDSNHLVIADAAGNWVSMLHTVYGSPFGTGLCVAGVGVNTGNGFPGVSVGPGRRIVTPLTPVLAMRDGVPWLALGTPSYPPPYIALVLLNMLTYGMSPEEAIEAPRFRIDPAQPGAKHLRTGWTAGTLTAETRIPAETLAGVERLGLTVAPLGDFNWHVGSVHLVTRDAETGTLRGYADSRRGGHAAGY